MTKILGLLAALLLCSGHPLQAGELPQDCGLVAAEAYARISPVAYWCRLLMFKAQTVLPPKVGGHVLTVWQMSPSGPVFAYDANGTFYLENVHEQDAEKIACALLENRPNVVLLKAILVKP